jgi:DNA polymerase I-like protein with 3'-5' exonuclease and polymerase domains
VIVLDIETNRAHDTIWCAVTRTENEVKVWYERGLDFLRDHFQEYLNANAPVIMHNGIGFDAPVLRDLWDITLYPSQVIDTLVLSRLYRPDIEGGHSLKAWGQRLRGDDGKIDFTDFDGGLTDEMVEYCKRDVDLTWDLYHHLSREMKAMNFSDESIKLEHDTAIQTCKQERNGFLLDVREATTLLADLKSRMADIEHELQEKFPPIITERWSEKTGKQLKDHVEVFNVGSRQQVAKRLESLGVKWKRVTETGRPVVDEGTLAEIDLPEAQLVSEYLMLQKRVGLISSWIDAAGDDNRVHGRVISNGAVTGRMTHSSPNMGQIPSVSSPYGKECRSLWTVPSGYKLVGCDLSGIELRCLAHYMQDDEWTDELLNGDIHTKNQLAAGLPERNMAKTMIYATLYGAGAAKIGSIVGGGYEEGEQILENFYANTPKLRKLQTLVGQLATEGTIKGLDGRRLHIRSERAALNTLLQSCGAIIAKQWCVTMHQKIRRSALQGFVKQVAFVHDEIQMEVKEHVAEQVAKIMEESATEAGKLLGFRVRVDAESKIGNSWYDTH